MKLRFSIAAGMVVVLIVAANLTVATALFAHNAEIFVGMAPTLIALQAVAFRLLRRRSNPAFWLGFLAFGSLAMASFAWGMTLPRELVAVAYPGQSPRLVNVSKASSLWLSYGSSAGDVLERWLGSSRQLVDPEGPAGVLVRSLVWSAPQLLFALAGGLCAMGLARLGVSRLGMPGRSPHGAAA
ncbi:hypothetical protein OJF2_73900 [Aquisphaera giovannonii]|uniref:Uncharacterized protein n=1 Tax=Aquisphaera giovannonii TaxID=406548 RepID=A0A5B9WDW9_9BACT|nr:hypothetical protein [Aquisphaera giovannonii]QEH38782.1 hypothetical protein OJF2_73900 [Aquisphaera giovannonii]